MTDPLLEVRDLTAAYGPVQVLFGLDLVVNPGEFVVMLGANGAGKTTTLRALSGLVSAHGTMNFDGSSILGDRAETLIEHRRPSGAVKCRKQTGTGLARRAPAGQRQIRRHPDAH